jgi:hypothetical protein
VKLNYFGTFRSIRGQFGFQVFISFCTNEMNSNFQREFISFELRFQYQITCLAAIQICNSNELVVGAPLEAPPRWSVAGQLLPNKKAINRHC